MLVITIIVIIITSTPLGWEPFSTLTSCPGSCPKPDFAFQWDAGQNESFDSGLRFWVYGVRLSHGLIHSLRTFTLVPPAWRSLDAPRGFCISQPQSVLWGRDNFKSLTKAPSQQLRDFLQELILLRTRPAERQEKAVSAAAMFSQVGFSQGAHPCLFPACAFKPKQQKSVLLLKRPRTFQETAPWGGHVGMSGPWLESLSEFTTWSAADKVSILLGRPLAGSWVLVFSGTLLLLCRTCLPSQLSDNWHFLNLPCSFSPLGIYSEKSRPSFSHSPFRLLFTHSCPQKSFLSPETFGLFPFSTMSLPPPRCSWLRESRPVSLSESPAGEWPACPQGQCCFFRGCDSGAWPRTGQKKGTNEWMKTMNK